jgi:hypothetical protein
MLGHIEYISSEVFGKLQIGGILSVGSQSSIAQKLASRFDASLSIVLILSNKKAELRLRRSVTGIRSDFPCKNVNFRINLLKKVENQTDSLIDNLDTYKFQMTVRLTQKAAIYLLVYNVFYRELVWPFLPIWLTRTRRNALRW